MRVYVVVSKWSTIWEHGADACRLTIKAVVGSSEKAEELCRKFDAEWLEEFQDGDPTKERIWGDENWTDHYFVAKDVE